LPHKIHRSDLVVTDEPLKFCSQKLMVPFPHLEDDGRRYFHQYRFCDWYEGVFSSIQNSYINMVRGNKESWCSLWLLKVFP